MLLGFTMRSMSDPFTITDQSGQARYEVTTVPDIAERLALRQAGGGPVLVAVVRDPGTGGFQVTVDARRAALVRSRGLIRKQYLIEGEGAALGVGGSVPGGSYQIFRDAEISHVAPIEVRREAARVGWTSGFPVLMGVAEGEDPVLSIGLVLGLEYLCDDRRAAVGELGSARRVIGGIGGAAAR
jgi:uncharacterized protein YxjI